MPKMAERLSERLDFNDIKRDSLNSDTFKDILQALDCDNINVKPQSIQKLLERSIQDPKNDEQYATESCSIVSIILRKVTAGEFTSRPDLLPSMLRILHMIKTSVYSSSSDKIKLLYFKTLISYPDEVYLKLEDDYEVLELFDLYCHQRIPIDLRVQPFNVLQKYLKVLPPDKKLQFVKKGINTWLLKLVPCIMSFVTINDITIENSLEALEIIANNLLYIDYFDNPHWKCILQSVYDPEKYPAIIKGLLTHGSDIWHRLWCVFIKILKNQITKGGTEGSPINSMLPVVETAFKMDVRTRCHAFHCWNVLTDIFSMETSEAYINKRIKLLVIPLYSNNAKHEDTVIAKLSTWWHLICGYYSKINTFAQTVIIPFIQFCFGKPVGSIKSAPGLITIKTQEHCMETFVNIFGHHNCDGCVSLPVVKDKIVNYKCLVDSRKDLMYGLSASIKIVANNPRKLRQPYICAWISFIKLICDIPDDNVRRDLLNELLATLGKLIKECHTVVEADIVLIDLILSFFDGDEHILLQLIKYTDEQNSPLPIIVMMILNPSFDHIYNRLDMAEAVEKFKPLAGFILKHCFHTSIFEDLIKQLSANCKSLVLWTTMTSSICEKKCDICPKMLQKMLLWPIKHLDLFTNVEISTLVWFKLLDLLHTKVGVLPVEDEIFQVFNDSGKINGTNSSFFLEASLILLIQKMAAENGSNYEKEVLSAHEIFNKIHGLSHSHPTFSMLVEILLKIFKKLSKDVNVNIAKQVLLTLKCLFTLLLPEIKQPTQVNAELLIRIEEVLKSIKYLLSLEAYVPVKQTVLDTLIEYAQCFGEHPSLKVTILDIFKMILNSMDNKDPSINILKKIINTLKQDSNCAIPIDQSTFTTPDYEKTPSKPDKKKTQRKEASIVNTVVEDGIEFVVVKSNWKFNPKKLTDNQKEKLQRNREDIPALYQDLSQSQDEFKLRTWKTDSQDTTTATTSSKSNELATNDEISSILKNMPNSDVMPKILENILTEKRNSGSEPSNETIIKNLKPINKQVKSRLALKDRVFRNVKNLIANSYVYNGEKTVKSSIDEISQCPQTPLGMGIKMSNDIINSAPAEINAERPTRIKKKPKKFEEMQLISLKRRRHSLGYNDSQNEETFEDLNESQDDTKNSKDEKINLNPSENCSVNKKKQNMLNLNLAEVVLKIDVNSDAHNEKILDIEQENFVQHENTSQHQISEPSVATEISPIVMDIESSVAVSNSVDNVTGTNQKNNSQLDLHERSSVQSASNKKRGKRKSRIETELAIDMVEGHPFLKTPSEKRRTRRKVSEFPVTPRRKSVVQKFNKTKSNNKLLQKSINLDSSQNSHESQDGNGSQDIIESSQDSTVSILSVKSSKTVKRIPVVTLENIEYKLNKNSDCNIVVDSDKKVMIPDERGKDCESCKTLVKLDDDLATCKCENDDSEFPRNKTAADHISIDLTENSDTVATSITLGDTDMDTQDIADADTQPMDSNTTLNLKVTNTPDEETDLTKEANFGASVIETQNESTKSIMSSLSRETDTKQNESTSKLSLEAEDQRKQDFLDNTLEISPIKTLSPVRDNKSLSPETSGDYVVIKLTSPVQINGEPYEKCDSPEIFTEDKVSPDKRDQSPPREDIHVTTASPRSLSLKKNKTQVRSGGRAAQMLGLCVAAPDRMQTIVNSEKNVESEDPKNCSPFNSSARRNLRILYNSTNENAETSEESKESKSFLRMNRILPAADSSPAVPILKRKLADITDDATVSPASKRKRVSFHDPPVSTTICVKKYIDSCAVRSPQNSAAKRLDRQFHSQVSFNLKSQKRLDTVFKLDTALTNAVESFSEGDVTPNTADGTEMSSLEPTPLVEVVKNSELNDVDPICMDLIYCKDPIDNIAGDLSSSAMRPLLVKEFAGKIETVGDLATMSELEVNRLCIKAPKVQVARKVLTEYAKKVNTCPNEMTSITEVAFSESTEVECKAVDVEMQTDFVAIDSVEVQTESLDNMTISTQTDKVSNVDAIIQTDESGSKSTADRVMSLLETTDFCEHLKELLDVPSKQSVASSLPLSAFTDTFLQKLSLKYSGDIIDRLLENHTSDSENGQNDNSKLSFIRDYLSERFSSKDLILLCSDLLKTVHDKNI